MTAGVAAALLAASSASWGPLAPPTARPAPRDSAVTAFVSPVTTLGNLAYRLSQLSPSGPVPASTTVPNPVVTPATRTLPAPLPTPTPTPTARPGPTALAAPVATPTPTPSTPALGSLLVDGCAWAPMIPDCSARVSVYSNGGDLNGRYDCMQLVRRWLRWAWNDLPAGGPAAQLWNTGPTLPVPLSQHANGGPDSPAFGDVLVFAASPASPAGHVGIVAGSHATARGVYLDVVEQNAARTGLVSLPVIGTTVFAPGRSTLLGWLRPAVSGPLPRPAVPLTITAAWPGGGGSWSGAGATFDGPGGAAITGQWSGYMCMGVRHDTAAGSRYTSGSCFWDGATVSMPDPSTSGTYSVVIEPGTEPPV